MKTSHSRGMVRRAAANHWLRATFSELASLLRRDHAKANETPALAPHAKAVHNSFFGIGSWFWFVLLDEPFAQPAQSPIMIPNHVFTPNTYEAASEAREKAQDAATQVGFMKQDIERLLMITEALWMLLQRAHGYTDEDLKNLINEIDLRDGCLDGRVSTKAKVECPSCHRASTIRQTKCIYCGQILQHAPFER